jgi:hypothetical protein
LIYIQKYRLNTSEKMDFWIDNYDGTALIAEVPSPSRADFLEHHHNVESNAGTYYTARGNEWGHEYFGTFGKSLFTLFQVVTGDSWAEAIGRSLLEGWFPMSTAVFFVTYILLHAVVLMNVVVAVLLEKMVTPEDEARDEDDLIGALEKEAADDIASITQRADMVVNPDAQKVYGKSPSINRTDTVSSTAATAQPCFSSYEAENTEPRGVHQGQLAIRIGALHVECGSIKRGIGNMQDGQQLLISAFGHYRLAGERERRAQN